MIAIHESAHAVVTPLDRPEGLRPEALDRRPRPPARHRGDACSPTATRWSCQEPDLRRQLIAIVAGLRRRADSSSASSPPASTTTSTRRPAWRGRWSPPTGCRSELGPVTIGEKAGEVFLGASLQELGLGRPGDPGADRPRGRADRRRGGRRRPSAVLDANWQRGLRDRRRADRARDALRAWRSRRCLGAPVTPTPARPRRHERRSPATGSTSASRRRAGRRVSRRGRTELRGAASWRSRRSPGRCVTARRRGGRPRSGASSSRRRRQGPRSRCRSARPGDLSFWAPNRGLLTVAGNATIPRGIFSWDGRELARSWRPSAAGAGDTARIAWAGPTEFWVVSEPSLPRGGAGLALCRFKDGAGRRLLEHPSRRRRPVPADDRPPPATGPSDCWFGGVGSQDALGERVGAFHLHWDGTDLQTVYGPQGRGGQRHRVPRRRALREHPGRSLAGEPHRSGRPRRARSRCRA